jgi:Tol biopolymer transport system component
MYETVHVEVTYDSDLYSVDIATGNLNRITDTPDIWELYPIFSPDCSKIAFVVRIDTETMKNVPQDIYIMNADGSNRVKLAHHEYGIYLFQGLHWSPDGRKIVYTVINLVTDNIDMFLINLENNSFIDFTDNLHIPGNYPSWSPDSSRISFSSGNATSVNKIYIMDIYTQNITELYQSSGFSCWSPDGSEIAFRNRFNVYEILAAGTDGENPRTLTSIKDIRISNPIWFPQ